MIKTVQAKFVEKFKGEPDFISRAPGRINLIGEHTDYNQGFVFPAAINAHIYLAFKAVPDLSHSHVVVHDLNDESSIDFSSIKRTDKTWLNYLLGILDQFLKKKPSLLNFQCLVMGDLPIGAGMSSSSALDIGFALGIDRMNLVGLEKMELALLSQKANHEFQGVKGGIMDQYAILFGQSEKALLLDCQSLEASLYPCYLSDYEWILINSMVTHDNSETAYNQRVEECASVVAKVSSHLNKDISSLRDLSMSDLSQSKNLLTQEEYLRAHFVLSENLRVHQFALALESNQMDVMGSLLYESHYGLQNEYMVSCTELDLLVQLAKTESSFLGSRMMGGGFGGCILSLVEKNSKESVDRVCAQYEKSTKLSPETYHVEITDGAIIL